VGPHLQKAPLNPQEAGGPIQQLLKAVARLMATAHLQQGHQQRRAKSPHQKKNIDTKPCELQDGTP
jgi:hypothetical protein